MSGLLIQSLRSVKELQLYLVNSRLCWRQIEGQKNDTSLFAKIKYKINAWIYKKGGNLYAYRIIENDTWNVQMTEIGMRKKGLFQKNYLGQKGQK